MEHTLKNSDQVWISIINLIFQPPLEYPLRVVCIIRGNLFHGQKPLIITIENPLLWVVLAEIIIVVIIITTILTPNLPP